MDGLIAAFGAIGFPGEPCTRWGVPADLCSPAGRDEVIPRQEYRRLTPSDSIRLRTLDDLQRHVHQELCASENLLPEQFVTRAQPLFARGELRAVEYTLLGLRSVRLGAIWAADQNVLYFYNAKGERDRKVKLAERPLDEAAPLKTA